LFVFSSAAGDAPWGWSLQSIELEETDGLLRFESISAESLHCSKSVMDLALRSSFLFAPSASSNDDLLLFSRGNCCDLA
jgi:hypothetical protein